MWKIENAENRKMSRKCPKQKMMKIEKVENQICRKSKMSKNENVEN